MGSDLRRVLILGLLLMATITSLACVHRQGQTFVTFTKNAGSNGSTTYDVYRETAQIASLSGLTKVATLDADSWHLLYDDSGQPTPHLSSGFMVPASAGETGVASVTLANTQGLLVWTPAASGSYYYAVVNTKDATVTFGTNSLTSPITETATAVWGAVKIEAFNDAGGNGVHHKYYRWEEYSAWKTRQWGYYGHRFNAYKPTSGSSFPMDVFCHPAASSGYGDPGQTGGGTLAVGVQAHDLAFVGVSDPYSLDRLQYGHSNWGFGKYDSDTDRVVPTTETRLVAYVLLVRDNASANGLSDGIDFKVDANRIYIEGGSMGSGSMHVASHYPTLFAACAPTIGYVDTSGYAGGAGWPSGQTVSTLMSGGPGHGLAFGDWGSLQWMVEHGYQLPPTIHTFNKDDGTVHPYQYQFAVPAFETAKQPYAVQWQDGNHAGFYIGQTIDTGNSYGSGKPWDLYRFVLNEAVPAFVGLSSSDSIGTITNPNNTTGAAGNLGQRNYWIDWQSSLHTFSGGSAIADAAGTFAISLKSTNGTITGGITIRRAQSFLPAVGSTVTWSTDNAQSGTGTLNSDGSVTVASLSIPTTAMRLTLTATGPAGHFATVFAGAIR